MKHIHAAALLLAAAYAQAARAEVIEKNLDVAAFEEIETKGAFDVVIAVGKPRKMVARGDKAAVARLRSSVHEGKLKLWQVYDGKRDYKQPQRLKVTLNVEKLTSVILTGAGDVSAYNINAKNFAAQMNGAGDLRLVGTCETLTARLSGAGDLDADVLKCKSVSATVVGVGDLEVYASETITGSVSGVGDLVVYGNPTIRNTKVTGMGDVSFR
jgi:hypothetical protein